MNTNPILINYPEKAAFGRVLPKNKIYEHGAVKANVKALFVEQVEAITWAYKLAQDTINLAATPQVPEIQIFTIEQRTPELDRAVLRCIDQTVQFPLVFELYYHSRIQMVACYKQPHPIHAKEWMISDYFTSSWLATDSARTALPLALDLAGLYAGILHRLIPLPPRPQEPLADLVGRVAQVMAKQRDIEQLTARLHREKHFNRKVEINSQLRQLKQKMDELRRDDSTD
ncbi:MAG: hypothetical protein RLZZ226_230 [Pseudomonadota bacterium]|jgi:hypothetical protein